MSQPASPFSNHAQNLYKIIQKQSWLLLGMVILTATIEFLTHTTTYVISKNCLAGGVLAWLSHWIFAKISLRHSGYRQRRQVVNSFYLAQATKWLVTLCGFALIFIYLQPLKAIWVFIGYFTLQLGQFLLLYRYKHTQIR